MDPYRMTMGVLKKATWTTDWVRVTLERQRPTRSRQWSCLYICEYRVFIGTNTTVNHPYPTWYYTDSTNPTAAHMCAQRHYEKTHGIMDTTQT